MTDPPSRRLWWGGLLAVCVVLLVPLALVDVPPLLDYPNHLARLFVLAFPDDPVLSTIYAQHWRIIPNLAIDVLAPPLLWVLPVHVAGRVVVALALLLPVLGCAAYGRAACGRRSLWPLSSGLVAYNAVFIMGFLNFQIAAGLALLAGAGWHALADRRPLLAGMLGAASAVALFFCHIFGVAFLGVLLGAREIARAWRDRRGGAPARGRALARAGLLAGVFAAPVALYLLAPLRTVGGANAMFSLPRKLVWLFDALAAYDATVWAASTLVVLAVVAPLALTGRLRGAAGSALAALALLAAYAAAPLDASGTSFIDARFPVLLALLLCAGFVPVRLPRGAARGLAAVLALVFVVRMISVARVWSDHARDVAALRAAIAPVTPGARVLSMQVKVASNPAYWAAAPAGRLLPAFAPLDVHMAALLTLERRAFWPFLFAADSKQPLRVRPPYDRIAAPSGRVPDWHALIDPAADPTEDLRYLATWRADFDFVLLLDPFAAGDPTRLLPERLTLVTANDMAALFRVRKP